MKTRHRLKKVFLVLCAVILAGVLCVGAVNAIVICKAKPYILEQSKSALLEDVDCI